MKGSTRFAPSPQKVGFVKVILICLVVLIAAYVMRGVVFRKKVPALQAPLTVELEMLLQTVPHKFPEIEKSSQVAVDTSAVPKVLVGLVGSAADSLQASNFKFRNGQSGYILDFDGGDLRSYYDSVKRTLSQDQAKARLVFNVMTDHQSSSGNAMVVEGAVDGFELEIYGSGVGTVSSQIRIVAKGL